MNENNTVDKGRGFAQASMIFGFASIASTVMMTVWVPYVCGSLAILFAILSSGGNLHMDMRAKAGTRSAVWGMVVNTVIIAAVIYLFLTNESLQKMFFETFESVYGMTFEEFSESLGGGGAIQ